MTQDEPNDHAAHYEESKTGRTLREQGAAKIREHDRKNREFARGAKRQADGV